MIRHPNFTGMQMDIVSRGYTPARYHRRRRSDARRRPGAADGRRHLDLRGSQHPLQLRRGAGDALEVRATDTDGAKFAVADHQVAHI